MEMRKGVKLPDYFIFQKLSLYLHHDKSNNHNTTLYFRAYIYFHPVDSTTG